MKSKYTSFEDFKKDINKEYSFRDICEINSWLTEEDFKKGQLVICKFHDEKTPSMQVGNHFYKCYGCGEKGDIFTFAQRLNNYSFLEAIIDIASSLKVEIDIKASGVSSGRIQKLRKSLEREWSQYLNNFSSEIKSNKELRREANRYFPFDVGYDKKENRAVLAYTKNERPLGFTKRALDDSFPKWKHSSLEECLTGLVNQIFNIDSLSNKEIIEAYVVEGPGDVSNMVKSGLPNTVAVSGTENFTSKVIDRLSSEGINKLVIVTDGDSAGDKARFEWCKNLIAYNYLMAMESSVATIPKDKDPGICTKEEIIEANENRVSVIDYYLDNIDNQMIKDDYSGRDFSKNSPIKRKLVERFALNIGDITEKEAEVILSMRKGNLSEDIENNKEYIGRLKSTAGFGEDMLEYDKFEDMDAEEAKKILKLRYKILN